jgi:hypothetical protein
MQNEAPGRLTVSVTGKGGIWQTKPPDAESASWGCFPESAGNRPHLSGARGVSQPGLMGFVLSRLSAIETEALTSAGAACR